MNTNFTVLYYTANVIDNDAAQRIRDDLAKKTAGLRVISVSQKPIDLGENICIGEVGASVYNLYNQVLIGAREVKTDFILCAEDDFLYSSSRYDFIPYRDDTFYYDINRWGLNKDGRYWWRPRTSFGTCIAPTKMLVQTLEERFQKYTDPSSNMIKYFSEPGKYEGPLGIKLVRMERIDLPDPIITFNHHYSLGKRRMVRPTDKVVMELDGWGSGADLWLKFMGPDTK